MKDVFLELLNLSVFELSGSEHFMTATLGLLSSAVGAYIAYLLIRRNENRSKLEKHFCEAIKHVYLANFYWDRGETRIFAEEMEEAAKGLLMASMYADNSSYNWYKILANNLLNQSRIYRIDQYDKEF